MPEEAAQQLAKAPAFAPASLENRVIQEFRTFFQRFKAPDPGFQDGSFVVRIYVDFAEVVGVYVFGMGVHFPGGTGHRAVKGSADRRAAFVRIGYGFVKSQEILRGFQPVGQEGSVLIAPVP